MKYEHIWKLVCGDVWAIDPVKMDQILAVLHQDNRDLAALVAQKQQREAPAADALGVAIVQVHGTIAPRMNRIESMSGGTTAEEMEHLMLSAAHDPSIATIVMDFDSPGGFVQGIPEGAAVINQVRAMKRVVGSVNHSALSAGYWWASQCEELFAAPSSMLGSIGVLNIHEWQDEEKAETKHEIIKIGSNKAEGHPFGPLSDDARARIMDRLQGIYDQFVGAVAIGRRTDAKTVIKDFGQGASIPAPQAMELGMIDGVKTLREVVHGELARIQKTNERQRYLDARRRPA